MQHHFEFDREHRILLLMVKGELRDADINAVDDRIRQHVIDLNPVAGITDFSGVTSFQLSTDDMWSAASKPSPYEDPTPCYIVAPQDLVFGLSRVFEIAAGRKSLSVARSQDEVFKALGVDNPSFERLSNPNDKYLVLQLGLEEFAIRIHEIVEVVDVQDITPLPQMAAEIRGVVDIRGKAVPVLDARQRFGLPEGPDTAETCVVVVEVRSQAGSVLAGILSDDCGEVLDMTAIGHEETYLARKVKNLQQAGRILTTTDLTDRSQGAARASRIAARTCV
jgi:chemotaxis signal transduction protein